MSNAIQFLDSMGSKQLTAGEYAAAVAELEVDEAQRQALLDRDHAALNVLLDGRAKLLFAICTPDDDQPERSPDDGDEHEVPDQEEPGPSRD